MARYVSHIPSRPPLAAVALALAATAGGCGLFGGGSSETPPLGDAESAATRPVESTDVRTSTGNVPGVLQPLNRPIVQGPLPLIYLVESPMTLRVTNVETGEEITTVDVAPPQILRVESRGVILGTDVHLGATLAPGTYALTPLSANAGVVRTEQVRARPTVPAPAASRPASAAPPADTPPPAGGGLPPIAD